MRSYGLMAVLTAVGVAVAQAQEVTPSAEAGSGWRYEITPYAWLAGLEGELTVGNHEAEFDKSFSDLFDATEVAGSVRLGAARDRFLVGALVDFVGMSTDELDVDDRPQIGSLDSDLLLVEAAVGYQIDGWAEGQTFGLMIGVRNTHVENDLTINGVGEASSDDDITDPMFYVLPSVPVFPSKIEGLRFNPVMGFGAGGDSDYVYELFPQVQYRLTDTMAARFGYRRVGYKFEVDDSHELDLSMAGLVLGLGIVL